MHRLLDWLEPRIGRFAMPNLTGMLIAGQVLVYVGLLSQPRAGVLQRLRLYPDAVWDGEVWRLITFLLEPPPTNPLFAFFFWWLFYLMGTALEQQWGEFRYNAFVLIGWGATTAAAMLVPGAVGENLFLQGSVFLAFARLYPDFQIMLFFVLPVKVKWLALLTWLTFAYQFAMGDWATRAMVLAAVLNYELFFLGEHLSDYKNAVRRKRFKAKAAPKGPMRHECAVCGRNSGDEPRVAFRYCSQCVGGKCYCPDHLREHEHVHVV